MKFAAAIALALCLTPAFSHDVITTKITWSKEISRLLNRRCVTCHQEFLTYAEARPWAKAMKEETGARRMPPWQAVKGFGDFRDDRGLTQEEIELISDWVEGGAPEGDPRFLPEKPKPLRWQDPNVPAGTNAINVTPGFRLPSSATVVAIRPTLAADASVQVVATRPDGTVEPLVWIYRFNPRFARTYYYRTPVRLPSGSVIEMSVSEGVAFTLFAKRR